MPASFAQVVIDGAFSAFGKFGGNFRLFCPLSGMEIASPPSDPRETSRQQSPHLRFLICQAGGTWAPRIGEVPEDHRGYWIEYNDDTPAHWVGFSTNTAAEADYDPKWNSWTAGQSRDIFSLTNLRFYNQRPANL
jgi:hypothetical protein